MMKARCYKCLKEWEREMLAVGADPLTYELIFICKDCYDQYRKENPILTKEDIEP